MPRVQCTSRFGGQMALGAFGATTVRLVLSAFILLAPTLLMGGTLPAAVAAVNHARRREPARGGDPVWREYGRGCRRGDGQHVSHAADARHAVYALVRLHCQRRRVRQCLVLVAASRCDGARQRRGWRNHRQKRSPRKSRSSRSAAGEGLPHPIHVYAAAAVVGFAFMLMELVWYRMLAAILGGTTYTFGLILSVALLGIGLGGALYPLCFRRRQPSLQSLSLTCGLEALFLAIPFALGDRLAIGRGDASRVEPAGFSGRGVGLVGDRSDCCSAGLDRQRSAVPRVDCPAWTRQQGRGAASRLDLRLQYDGQHSRIAGRRIRLDTAFVGGWGMARGGDHRWRACARIFRWLPHERATAGGACDWRPWASASLPCCC